MGFPMFRFLWRKMWNTRWLTLSTLAGLIVAVAFTTSIPMYADGALKRVVAETLKEKSTGFPAGSLLVRYQAAGGTKTDMDALKGVMNYIQQDLPSFIGLEQDTYSHSYSIRGSELSPVDPTKVDASRARQLSLMTMGDLSKTTELKQGRMAEDKVLADGTIEVVMVEEAMFRSDVHIGDVFYYPIYGGLNLTLKVKVVGAVEPLDSNSSVWFQGLEGLMNNLFVNEQTFIDTLLTKNNIPIHNAYWYYDFDLSDIQTSQLTPLGKKLERLDIELYQKLKDTKVEISFADTLRQFKTQGLQLQTMLFTLAAPMIAMVFYFIMMNARQALDKQRSDIAVLRSRGAKTKQIIGLYLVEGLILGVVAMVLGPMLGWFMAKSIGSANGFLSFVNRKSIPIGFSSEAMIAGGVAVAIAILATVIPAIIYARSSIVSYKQQLARGDRGPVWQRWFLDVLLLGVAGYGWYMFSERQILTTQTGMTTDQLSIQPFLFFVPALSIFALGLFFLRVFPWLLKLFNWIGKKILPVPLYLTLTQLSRSSKGYYPLMILLILTLGLGVYNATAARTIELNSTDRTHYKYGADVIIQSVWEGTPEVKPNTGNKPGSKPGENPGSNPGQSPGGPGGNNNQPTPTKVLYNEPPFEIYRTLDGVEAAARVLQTKGNLVISGKSIGQGTVMGIDNEDFMKVGWFRDDLFPLKPQYYLSYLGLAEHAALIPQGIADRYQLKLGDTFSVGFTDGVLDFAVVGILPYWPSQYPDKSPFIIANIDYIYDQLPMIPYDVWIKMKDGALVAPIVESLMKQGIELASVKDVGSELITQARHPSRGGVFGILSLGFLVSVIITLAGYILFWFFNLSGRVVQFGVLRAMGLTGRQLTGMLLLEQVFTAGLSIGLGIGIGKLASLLFLPFLQTADNVAERVPPFRVIFNPNDTNSLYVVVALMMGIGALLLLLHIRRLRVHQAVKMGEER